MTETVDSNNTSIWKISIISTEEFLPSLEEIMYAAAQDNYPSITAFEIEGDPENKLMEIYFADLPDKNAIEIAVAETAKIFGIAPPTCTLERVIDKDWVAESQKLLTPIEAGDFYLYGSHDEKTIPSRKIPILMEAGQAFGTGSHETTNGCLLAIDALGKSITPNNILDLGCGSGVLAVAMAKIWQSKIIASDIDPIATKTTIENLKSNGIELVDYEYTAQGVAVITSNGFENGVIASSGPYDLIVANILAEPLKQLAPDIVKNLSPRGILVLSGLLQDQDNSVRTTYEKQGLHVKSTFPINEWQTLVLEDIDQ